MSYAGLSFGESVGSCVQNADCPASYVCCDRQCVKSGDVACASIWPAGSSLASGKPGGLKCPPNSDRNVAAGGCSCRSGYKLVMTSESPWGMACLKPGETVQQSLKAGVGLVAVLGIAAVLGVGYVAWGRA